MMMFSEHCSPNLWSSVSILYNFKENPVFLKIILYVLDKKIRSLGSKVFIYVGSESMHVIHHLGHRISIKSKVLSSNVP